MIVAAFDKVRVGKSFKPFKQIWDGLIAAMTDQNQVCIMVIAEGPAQYLVGNQTLFLTRRGLQPS